MRSKSDSISISHRFNRTPYLHTRRIHPVPQRRYNSQISDAEEGVEFVFFEGLVAGGGGELASERVMVESWRELRKKGKEGGKEVGRTIDSKTVTKKETHALTNDDTG